MNFLTQQQQGIERVDKFLDSFSSKYTMKQYQFHLNRFFDRVGSRKDAVSLINADNIIDYIVQMKRQGYSYAYRNNGLSALKYYHQMNDIEPPINWKKISNYLGESTTATDDLRGYTHQEIQKLLEVADAKYRAVILTYASTGMRREALIDIKLKDMEYLEDYKLYKIKIYRKTKHEQICFTTPEAATAINLYLKLKREKRPNDPYFHHINNDAISKAIRKLNIKSLMRQTATRARQGQYRESVPSVHGLRKFAITQMKRAKMDSEIRKILTGHSIGVASRYIEFTEDDLLNEYLKAVDFLTINEENKLRRQVETLTMEKTQFDKLQSQIDKINQLIKTS